MTALSKSKGPGPSSRTLIFLFTDLEGSTRLWEQFPEAMKAALERHDALLRAAVESSNGQVIKTTGDGLSAVFASALDGVSACLTAQRGLLNEPWGEIGPLRVRMGLHAGEAQLRGGDYYGPAINRAARLMSVAHGGQVLLSAAAASLVVDLLPAGMDLRGLGEHRLKDLERPERIFQLIHADLAADFPPLKALDHRPNNLPAQPTAFIGREAELGEIMKRLNSEGVRLLTLTGPGGIGKTRMALQAAADLIDRFEDGVYFVDLAPIRDPESIPAVIAQTLGLRETTDRPLSDELIGQLRTKTMLLLLDNFEQVTGAASEVVDLLRHCPQLKLLVTSREVLHVRGETILPVPPLALPRADPKELSIDQLTQCDAVRLFIERAQAVKPAFIVTDENARVVAKICLRLDGLPLAIELAAARIKLLPPQAMLARLEHPLEFLTSGARDLPARQQTLRNAIAWSYDLLDENEQKLFRQVSVFVGGCMVDAVEAAAGDNPARVSVLDQLGSLLDKSLLREVEGTDGEPRFVMLETLREFGLERLEASGEQEMIRYRHANFFLSLAEQAEAGSESVEQVQWINRMEQEHDNLRAALEWSKAADGTGELCLRLAGTLGLFWEARGYFGEGRERLSAVLSTVAAQGRTAARAKLLARAAELAYRQSDYAATVAFAEESLAICREVGDKQGIASALIKLGNAAVEAGDYLTASGFLEEALTIWRELEDKHGTARALISLGWTALRPGDTHLANERLEEALALSRELEDTRSIGFELSGLGEVAMRQGDYARATRLIEESLELRRQLGNKWGVGVSLGMLGWVAMREGDWNRAIARLGESLEVRREIGDMGGSAWCLERLAEVALAQGKPEKAVRLLSAASAQRIFIGSVIDPVDQPEYESTRTSLRAELGEERFAATWDEGRALTLEQAIAYALES